MCELGFVLYLEPELQSHVITSFRYPHDPRFGFEDFYRWLGERGLVIYRRLIQAVRDYVNERAMRAGSPRNAPKHP